MCSVYLIWKLGEGVMRGVVCVWLGHAPDVASHGPQGVGLVSVDGYRLESLR
jgi:hypothetical protein